MESGQVAVLVFATSMASVLAGFFIGAIMMRTEPGKPGCGKGCKK